MRKRLLLLLTLAIIGMAGTGYVMPKEVCAEETASATGAPATSTPAPDVIGGAYNTYTDEASQVTYAYHTSVIGGKVYATDVHISGMTIENDITFPKSINGYPIYSLGRDVMKDGTPVSTKNNFFYNCKMMNYIKLDLSACTELQKINPYAFAKESYIIIIIMPETLREVGKNAFMACSRAVVDASKVLDVVFDGTKDEDCSLEWVSYYSTDAKRYFGDQNVTVAMAVGKVRFEYNADYPVYPLTLVATEDNDKISRIRYGSTPMKNVAENTYHYNRTNVYADPNQSAASLQGSRVTPPTSKYEDFDGYYTNDGVQVIDKNGLFIPGTEAKLNTTNNVLYARYTPHQFTITYDVNCPESELLPDSMKSTTKMFTFGASRNDLFGGINIPQRKGYKFDGWMLSTKKALYSKERLDMNFLFCQDTEDEMNAIVSAVWSPESFDVTIHANRYEGDTESHTGKAAYDENIAISLGPDTIDAWEESMKGSYIVGFALSPDGEVLKNNTIYGNSDKTEYWIIWKKEYYRFQVHSMDTGEVKAFEVDRDEKFTFSDDIMTRPGYHISSFTFRYDDKDEAGNVVQKTVEKEVGTVIEDACPEFKYHGGYFAFWAEVYVNWKPDTYTIKFDANADDVAGLPGSRQVPYGKSFRLPDTSETFYRKGYTFLGWTTEPKEDLVSVSHAAYWNYYDEKGNPIYHDKSGIVENPAKDKSVTYYAHWMKKFTHVGYRLFDKNGKYIGLKEMLDLTACTEIHEYGKEEKLPTVEKDNYRFLGWKDTKTGAIYTDKIPKDVDYDMILEPQFKQYDYKVLPGKNVEKLWFPESALRSPNNLGPGDEIAWTHVKLKDPVHYVGGEIEFVNNSTGEVIFKDELAYQDGNDIRLPDECFIKMPESDVTVNVTYKPKTYCAYLVSDDPSGGEFAYFTYGEGGKITTKKKKKGYVLKEWIVYQGPDDMVGKPITKFDKDFWYSDRQIILTPVWENGTYTLTFDPNGGKVDTSSVSFVNGNVNDYVDYVLPTPEREGYSFLGWFDDNDKVWTKIDVTREDYTLIAKWEKNGESSVTDYSLDKEEDVTEKVLLRSDKNWTGSPNKGYYHDQLTDVEKQVYATLRYQYDMAPSGGEKIPMDTSEIISDVKITPANVYNAAFALRREHVEIFWIRYFSASGSWKGNDGKYHIQVKPRASYARSSYIADAIEYDRNLRKVLRDIPSGGSDYDKIKRIYHYIAENYSYRNETKILGATTSNETRSVGYMLARHEGCCESYARLTKLLCDLLDVECIIVDGYDHMWNQVKIDGKWYIVDTTWGDRGDVADEWFFLIGSDSVKDEHHTIVNYDFYRYDENGNRIPITEYACMPAPEVEKTDYVCPETAKDPEQESAKTTEKTEDPEPSLPITTPASTPAPTISPAPTAVPTVAPTISPAVSTGSPVPTSTPEVADMSAAAVNPTPDHSINDDKNEAKTEIADTVSLNSMINSGSVSKDESTNVTNTKKKTVKVIKKTLKKGKKITIKTGKWKVKNKKIVSISKKKVVKGLKKGKTTITGTIKGVSYRYIVTVR